MNTGILLRLLLDVVALLALGVGLSAMRARRDRDEGVAEKIADLQKQVDYWRVRCERLTDAALVRAGAIHQPTMEDPKRPLTSHLQTYASALATQEIDSSKLKETTGAIR